MLRSPATQPDWRAQVTAAAQRFIGVYLAEKDISLRHPAASDVYLQPLLYLNVSHTQQRALGLSDEALAGAFIELLIEVDERGHEWRIEVALLTPTDCFQPIEGEPEEPYLCRKKLATVWGDREAALTSIVSPRMAPIAPLLYQLLVMSLRDG